MMHMPQLLLLKQKLKVGYEIKILKTLVSKILTKVIFFKRFEN